MFRCFAKKIDSFWTRTLFLLYRPCHLAQRHFYDTKHLASHLANPLVSASVNLSFGQHSNFQLWFCHLVDSVWLMVCFGNTAMTMSLGQLTFGRQTLGKQIFGCHINWHNCDPVILLADIWPNQFWSQFVQQ